MTRTDHRPATLRQELSNTDIAASLSRIAFGLLLAYIVVSRLIADIFTLPIGASIHPTDLVAMALLGIWGLWMVTSGLPFPIGIASGLGAVFVALLVLAPVVNAGNLSTFEANGIENGLVRGTILVGLFLVTYHLAASRRSSVRILAVIVVTTLFQAVIAVYEMLIGAPFLALGSLWQSLGLEVDPRAIRSVAVVLDQRLTGELRPAATAPHPLVLAGLLAVSISICLAFYLYSDNRRTRRWLLVAFAFQLLAIGATNQRTGFVALAVIAIVLGVTQLDKLPSALPLIASAVVGAVAVAVVSPQTPRLLLNFITGQQTDHNIAVRASKYEIFPDLLEKRPLLGPGYETSDPGVVIFDNGYLTGLVELGILGFGVLVAFLLVIAGRSFGSLRKAPGPDRPLLLASVLAAVTFFTTMATFDVMSFAQLFPTVLIVMAVGLARADDLRRAGKANRIRSTKPGRL